MIFFAGLLLLLQIDLGQLSERRAQLQSARIRGEEMMGTQSTLSERQRRGLQGLAQNAMQIWSVCLRDASWRGANTNQQGETIVEAALQECRGDQAELRRWLSLVAKAQGAGEFDKSLNEKMAELEEDQRRSALAYVAKQQGLK